MAEPTQTEVRQALDNGLEGLKMPRKVVVVGAGLSGLAIAHELTQRGSDVTVLEASERPGGRACTLRAPFADGLYAEAGAMTVTPYCHYAMHYMRESGVELEMSDLVDTDFSYFFGGRFAGTDPASLNRLGPPMDDEERRMSTDEMVDRYVQAICREIQPEISTPNGGSPSAWPLTASARSTRSSANRAHPTRRSTSWGPTSSKCGAGTSDQPRPWPG
ncbi:FAD-dependent oxidoreductase [Streptomyces sp. WC2508]|uniref:FAD-dependent oxidoreductase n=1 Tax=Streptomyces sp. WC2508 TaxID=3461405 RepID=UPI0040440FED